MLVVVFVVVDLLSVVVCLSCDDNRLLVCDCCSVGVVGCLLLLCMYFCLQFVVFCLLIAGCRLLMVVLPYVFVAVSCRMFIACLLSVCRLLVGVLVLFVG